MQNIIYKSDNIIPWDTQSAFKMTGYKSSCEENMVFCYVKTYVHGGDLVLCSYCFDEHPGEKSNMRLYINASPENREKYFKIDFGFNGISCADFSGAMLKDGIFYNSFKTDDEQGFYWCGEITLSKDLLKELCDIELKEKSLVTINMVQNFDNGDFSVLYGNRQDDNYNPVDNMEVFVVLNY